MTNYILYARKSTEDDDKQVMSIESQLFELREFAKKENLTVIGEYTESKSAKKPGREQFGLMMSRVESLQGVGILAWHPDRLARNSIDGGRIIYAVDTSKITSLRFPTFWFEPTPQGLFMLQVAFGQSKYYSDNLKQNVERGMRQKVRRGEWLTKAPFGYINNSRTRNIEPDPTKAKIIVRAFEEFAKGMHGLVSLSSFLLEHNVTKHGGGIMCKASVRRMLSNKAYLGLTKHKDEYHPGSFPAILHPDLFNKVQECLKVRSRPRKTRKGHNFAFTGLFACGECQSMITAQWATGKCGGRYRYYRCTKKKGVCTQKYLREDKLTNQLQDILRDISLPISWTDYISKRFDEEAKKIQNDSVLSREHLKAQEQDLDRKLDSLVNLYLEGDIPKDTYLTKKNDLLVQKVSTTHHNAPHAKNWVEPARGWLRDICEAAELRSSTDLASIRTYFKRTGTNPQLFNASVAVSFCPPTLVARSCRDGADLPPRTSERAPAARALSASEVANCDPTENRTPITALRRPCPNR